MRNGIHLVRWLVGLGLCASLVAGCATDSQKSPELGELKLSQRVWDHYQRYLRDMGTTGSGAFAVSRDGRSSFYSYCPGVGCITGATYKQEAIKGCQSQGSQCVIFAYDSEIVVKYKVSE
jgi:hypothetical protein